MTLSNLASPAVRAAIHFKMLALLAAAMACAGGAAHAQTISLGAANNFAVLAGSGVTNTGATHLVGEVGVSPGTSITGNPPSVVSDGTLHRNDSLAVLAHANAATAYNVLAGLAVTQDLSGQNLGGRTLGPGVYRFSSSAQLTGQLTLDGQGQTDPRFVFQIGSTLTTATASSIIQINGADSSDVYFQVGSSATLGTGTHFTGTIIARTSDTLTAGATVNGRVIALDGAVTLDTNFVSAHCPAVSLAWFVVETTPAALLRVALQYTEDGSMNLNTVDSGDVELRRNGGAVIPATLVSRVLSPNSMITAVYTFAAPNGGWDSTDNGDYALWLRPSQVSDSNGTFASTQLIYTYGLWFDAPAAGVSTYVVANGGTYMDVLVLYTDAAGFPPGISVPSIGNGDVEMAGPFGYLAQGTLVSTSVPQAAQVLATYRFPAPGGFWDCGDNGAYTVRTRTNEVLDVQGHAVPAQVIGTYGLYFQTPSAVPTGMSVAAGGTTISFTVTYRANGAMSWGSFGSGDVELAGPGGYLGASTMTNLAYVAATNSYVATYRIPARGGSWDGSDNGTYSLRARPIQVWDELGYVVPALELASYWLWFPPGFVGSNCGSIDFDGDGDAGTSADVEAFFACMAGSCCETCGSADFDRDGDTATNADIEAFFRVLGGGPC